MIHFQIMTQPGDVSVNLLQRSPASHFFFLERASCFYSESLSFIFEILKREENTF